MADLAELIERNKEWRRVNHYTSMGRNANVGNTCGFPVCAQYKADPARSGGWCQHPSNRVYDASWPLGFTPSCFSDGGCDQHTATLTAEPQ